MTHETELLEKHGLIQESDILSVKEFSTKRFLRFYEQLYSAIYKRQVENHYGRYSDDIDPFTFMASASMRADSTCGSLDCRSVKLDFLGRYTALYANKVILPLWLSSPESAARAHETAKYELSRSVQSLIQLRPLIESGLIEPVVMRSPHCKHTSEWAGRMIDGVHRAAMSLAKNAAREFQVIYQIPEKAPTGRATVYIDGPDDLIEHGNMVWTWNEERDWRKKSWRYDRDGQIELRGAKKTDKLYEVIFNKIASDTTFYLAFARMQSARYLSDREGETILLDDLTEDDDLSTSSIHLQRGLRHLVPLLGDLPLAALLRIRKEERDSFLNYRAALGQLLNDVLLKKGRISKREIRELYREKIEPSLHRMKSELRQERRRQTRRVVGGVASLAASVALGAFGGFLPLLAKGAAVGATAMMGGRLFSKAAEAVCEHGADLRDKNDFYFLLRIAEESE